MIWRCLLLFAPFFSSAVSICKNISSSNNQLLATLSSSCPSGYQNFYGAGVNIFDVFWDGSTGMKQPNISYNDSLLALDSASVSNVRFFRFFASCWGPYQVFWLNNSLAYWSEMDRVMRDISERGFFIIPSIGYDQWDLVANVYVENLNETKNDLVKNVSSVSYGLAKRYFEEFVSRYANNSNILFWELGNELNLLVNLPPPWCGIQQCFNTTEMLSFTSSLSAIIRRLDPFQRPIGSGFSAPRPTAWHQENCPLPSSVTITSVPVPVPNFTATEEEKGHVLSSVPSYYTYSKALRSLSSSFFLSSVPSDLENCSYWGLDTEEQFREMLALQHKDIDIITIHHYGANTTCYFQPTNCANASLAQIAAEVASEQQKVLFVGEYGGPSPGFTGPTEADQRFPVAMLDVQVANRRAKGAFQLSAIWAWECPSHRGDMNCIYPNSTRPAEAGSNQMLEYLQQANAALN